MRQSIENIEETVDDVGLIYSNFPDLTQVQRNQFEQLAALYKEWNGKINVISRKDVGYLYERHVLHSLGIAKAFSFPPQTKILDVGTGGGFPGIPLAILFPQSEFLLVDSIGKKILVADSIAKEIGLTNLVARQARAENVQEKFQFVVSRAVTSLPKFIPFIKHLISSKNIGQKKNGIFYLKGGDFVGELEKIESSVEIFDLSKFYKAEFFKTKKVVYIALNN